MDDGHAHGGILLPTRENPPNHALHACVLHDAKGHHDVHIRTHDHGMGLLHDDRSVDNAHLQNTLDYVRDG